MCTETYSSYFYMKLLRGNAIKCYYSRLTLKGVWNLLETPQLSTFGMKLHLARSAPASVCASTAVFLWLVNLLQEAKHWRLHITQNLESERHFVAQKHNWQSWAWRIAYCKRVFLVWNINIKIGLDINILHSKWLKFREMKFMTFLFCFWSCGVTNS